MAPHLTSFCSHPPPSFPNSAICRTPPLAAKGGCGGRHPLAYPAPCPSELSRHARGRSSPALGSKLHCLMVQWGAGPPVSPALGLSHHAHLPPFLQILGWGEAPKGDQRPAIWSQVPVNHSSLRLERGKEKHLQDQLDYYKSGRSRGKDEFDIEEPCDGTNSVSSRPQRHVAPASPAFSTPPRPRFPWAFPPRPPTHICPTHRREKITHRARSPAPDASCGRHARRS